jgi:hypothetical protein
MAPMAGRRDTRPHHDFDLILAADLAGRGETIEMLASHLEILAGRGLELGLLWLNDPAAARAAAPARSPAVDQRIAGLVRRHVALPIERDAGPQSCRVLLVYQPELAAATVDWRPAAAPVLPETVLVVLSGPILADQGGAAPGLDVPAVAARLEERFPGPQLWWPTGPELRRQCLEHAAGLPL